MKADSMLNISKKLSSKSTLQLSAIFSLIFIYFSLDMAYFSKSREVDVLMASSGNYTKQLLENSDSYELARNLNSYIKTGIIDEFMVIDITNDTILLHNYLDIPHLSTSRKKTVAIELANFSYSIQKESIVKSKYKILFLKRHSLLIVLFFIMVLVVGISLIVLTIRANIKKVIKRISDPVQNYSDFLIKTGASEENNSDFKSEYVEINNIHSRIKQLKGKIIGQMKSEAELKKSEALSAITSQVAHDIRSPLAALNMISKEMDSLPETTRLMLRSSINRIQDIANNLLQTKKGVSFDDIGNVSNYLVMPIIEEVISEKRTALRSKPNIFIESNLNGNYGSFIKVEQSHLKRVISNLINNSVEAFDNAEGVITISQKKVRENIEIKISDNGKGIPQSVISKIGERGVSFGKESSGESGSGLGLHHAKESLKSWGGSLKIESIEGKKTDIILSFPLQKGPSWFVAELKIKEGQKIIVIDDDSTIHQVWGQKLKSFADKNKLGLVHFTNPHDLKNWVNINSETEVTFLCDYEFIGYKTNGLDLINELNISKNSILVTSRYGEEDVRCKCEELGVKLIPKMLAEVVPVVIKESNNTIDLVHVDDDKLIRLGWEMRAKQAGKKILSFEGPEKLCSALESISKETPFYIDSSLGKDVISGQELAKELFNLGYENLYLSTGYEKEKFSEMPWIKDVIGKEAPFSANI